jgi:DNA-binding CsgD family transcriptional regulator
MAFEIVGRDEELASVRAFVGGADQGMTALVLEGEAGIGKSTLWLAGIAQAHRLGLRVLLSRPTEAERGLAYVGLGDLFEDALDEFLPRLSSPRRRALEVALLRVDASHESAEPRALAVGLRDVLQSLAEKGRVLVAIDDVQWLDASSSSALAFALRRLDGAGLRVLLARRTAQEIEPSELERASAARRVVVGPLSAGALHRFLRDRIDRSLPRQTLLRIHERSGGNPFFALEIARMLPQEVDPLQPLPVPETLDQLVRARLAGLPSETHDALALASALGTPSTSLLERAGVDARVLEPALAAAVIERTDDAIRFTHPLLSSVLYRDLGDGRAAVHARLADLVDDQLVRARHLALSCDRPDADIAATLDDAASVAAALGASAVAAEFAEHALRLAPPGDHESRHRRALVAARAQLAAGEWTRARSIANELLAATHEGPPRAEILLFLSEFEIDDLAVPVLEDALREATGRPKLQAAIHIRLASARRFRKGFSAAREDARIALDFAERAGDDVLRLQALGALVWLGRMVGDPEGAAAAQEAQRLARAIGAPELISDADVLCAIMLGVAGELDQARNVLQREYDRARERDEPFAASVVWELAWVELWRGQWELAAQHAARAAEIRSQYGLELNQDHIPSAWVALYRGQLDFARSEAERGLELCEEQVGLLPPLLLAARGLADGWNGDARAAVDWLARADRQADALGWHEPYMRPWTTEYVESLLELGRLGDAVQVLDAWEADAVRLERRRIMTQVTSCRGLVAAAEGDVGRAASHLEDAVAGHEAVGDTFGRSRALLSLGVVRRRARQKAAAREAIEAALFGFEELGAATWIDKARAELGSIGGRRQTDGLTGAERRVAVLVAEGRTNREVAAALFLAERTVAGHLTRVYAKLGVRSRAELARRLD